MKWNVWFAWTIGGCPPWSSWWLNPKNPWDLKSLVETGDPKTNPAIQNRVIHPSCLEGFVECFFSSWWKLAEVGCHLLPRMLMEASFQKSCPQVDSYRFFIVFFFYIPGGFSRQKILNHQQYYLGDSGGNSNANSCSPLTLGKMNPIWR